MQTNDLFGIELLVLDRNTWNHLTVWKQIIDIKLNYLCWIEILETIYCVQINEL